MHSKINYYYINNHLETGHIPSQKSNWEYVYKSILPSLDYSTNYKSIFTKFLSYKMHRY